MNAATYCSMDQLVHATSPCTRYIISLIYGESDKIGLSVCFYWMLRIRVLWLSILKSREYHLTRTMRPSNQRVTVAGNESITNRDDGIHGWSLLCWQVECRYLGKARIQNRRAVNANAPPKTLRLPLDATNHLLINPQSTGTIVVSG